MISRACGNPDKRFITMDLQAEMKSVFPDQLAAVLDLHCA